MSQDKEDESGTVLKNDPFAPRQGRPLQWRNVNMKVNMPGKDGGTTTILDNVWGQVPAGQTTAILGPSGSGKTSLLNVLSGRIQTSGNHRPTKDNQTSKTPPKVQVQADMRLNSTPVDPTHMSVRKSIAFVAQDDSLQATATVREALFFSAKLRLGRENTDADLHALVKRMITELGLTRCADTLIGNAELQKGISGGERYVTNNDT